MTPQARPLDYDENAAAAMLAALRGCPAPQWLDTLAVVAKVLVEHPERLASLPCCDMHNVHCEPPSELCCRWCTEVGHPEHRDDGRCVIDLAEIERQRAATRAQYGRHPLNHAPDGGCRLCPLSAGDPIHVDGGQ